MFPMKMELQGDTDSAARKNRAPCLAWEDLTVAVASNLGNASKRKLLNGLSVYAEPNRIMALMGPSGSGKSTLLDALAGRLPTNIAVTGNILFNGNKRSTDSRDVSYVTQEDYFFGTLTVRETLTYAALLRLPANITQDEIVKVVNKTVTEMGLQDCADRTIGNWHLRGISNGEKRRLSISIEMLTQPQILFLDEPTSGLDSAAAFYVILSLRNIARDGRMVICSVHQPSCEIFDLFDDLLLLAGGETVYLGEREMAVKFFANAGFPCPTRKNPPEHFLRCVSSEFNSIATLMQSQNVNRTPSLSSSSSSSSNSLMDFTTEEIKAELIKNYKNSALSTNARKKIREISLTEDLPIRSKKTLRISWWKQLCILTRRSFLNMSRDIGYYWIRILCYILVSVTAGMLYFNIGTSNQAILSRGKCDGFIYGFMVFLSIGGLPFFLEELKVFTRERFGRHYGEAVYVLSNFLSSFPFVLAISISSGTILYHMVNFHPGFTHYCYFCMNLLCCIAVTEASMLSVAAFVSNLLVAIGTAAGLTVLMMMPSNIFRRLVDLPKFFWRYPMSYLSYVVWSIQGQYKNDLIGLEFEPAVPGDPKIKGEVILQDTFAISMEYSKWWDLAALLCLLISYRSLLFFMLKHRERVWSLFYNGRALLGIFVRRPFLRETYISSKRDQTLYPLSVQEGLSSLMP